MINRARLFNFEYLLIDLSEKVPFLSQNYVEGSGSNFSYNNKYLFSRLFRLCSDETNLAVFNDAINPEGKDEDKKPDLKGLSIETIKEFLAIGEFIKGQNSAEQWSYIQLFQNAAAAHLNNKDIEPEELTHSQQAYFYFEHYNDPSYLSISDDLFNPGGATLYTESNAKWVQSREKLKNTYIFNLTDNTLDYINRAGKTVTVMINDSDCLAQNIKALAENHNSSENVLKLQLSEQQVKKLITDNGGHVPHQFAHGQADQIKKLYFSKDDRPFLFRVLRMLNGIVYDENTRKCTEVNKSYLHSLQKIREQDASILIDSYCRGFKKESVELLDMFEALDKSVVEKVDPNLGEIIDKIADLYCRLDAPMPAARKATTQRLLFLGLSLLLAGLVATALLITCPALILPIFSIMMKVTPFLLAIGSGLTIGTGATLLHNHVKEEKNPLNNQAFFSAKLRANYQQAIKAKNDESLPPPSLPITNLTNLINDPNQIDNIDIIDDIHQEPEAPSNQNGPT